MRRFLQNAESHVSVTTTRNVSAPTMSSGHSELLFAGTASFASGLFMTIIVLFFPLMSGGLSPRRLVDVPPRIRDKRTAVMVSR